MKVTTTLLILSFSTLFSLNLMAQSKKDIKKNKEEMLAKMKMLIASGKSDSLISYVRSKNNSVDTSAQAYELTNQQEGVMEMVVIDGDTMYIYNMQTFAVVDVLPYGDKEKDLQFRRLKYHVKKVYPLAKVAAQKLTMYNDEIKTVKSESKKRKLMKLREKALKEEFEDVIKDMSKTSGRVLIKLIDRETGESTYDIIKEMRGGFKAWTYQGIGKFYGADLKQRYSPEINVEDEMIERIVQSIIAEQN